MNKLFSKIWQGFVAGSLLVAPATYAGVTIYMLGDSTMDNWNGYCPLRGQGKDFHYWFDASKAAVVNYGKSGMAAEGYYDMFWKKGCSNPLDGSCIATKVKTGDYVYIEFGINDVNKSSTEGFWTSMTAMVNEARALGAYPIIMSPIQHLWFEADTVHYSYRQYPTESRLLADSLKVPFIDMYKLMTNYMISVGDLYSAQFIFNHATTAEYSNLKKDETDDTHLQINGANAMGRIITEQTRFHEDLMVRKLGDYMAPMYQVSVKVSPEGADSATSLDAYYPEGMPVVLKTIPKSGKKFLGWYDGDGKLVSGNEITQVISPYIHTFKMKPASTQYTAVYEGGTAQKYSGDGKALSSFPATTPRKLEDVVWVPFSPMDGGVADVKKDIKKFFDAFKPDSGVGFSEDNWAHTGDGFFNAANELSSYSSYMMYFPKEDTVTLAVRFANGTSTDRMFNVSLNGDHLVYGPYTGAWDKWDTAYVVASVPKGYSELRFVSLTKDGAPNIDAFGFSIDDVCRASDTACVNAVIAKEKAEKDSLDSIANLQTIHNSDLYLNTLSNASVSVFDMRGKLVAKREMVVGDRISSVELNEMVKTSGLYHVVIRKGSKVMRQKIAKTK